MTLRYLDIEVVRFSDLDRGDEFIHMSRPYRVIKVDDGRVYYRLIAQMNQSVSHPLSKGRNSQEWVEIIKKQTNEKNKQTGF